GEFTLTSITSYREYQVEASTDDDSRPVDVIGFNQSGDTAQDQFTQELRLASPADDSLNFVIGLFYFDQTVDRTFTRGFEFVPGQPGVGVSSFSADTENWALFGEANYTISDAWRLVLGARYTEDELDFVFQRVRTGLSIGIPEPVEPTPGETDESDFSGKVALEWDFSDEGMAYLSYVEGYKGPAFDLTFGTDPTTLERVDPETSESWELGLKSAFFDNRLILNIAVFRSEYADFQSQAFFDEDGPSGCPVDNPGCNPDNQPGTFLLINAGEVATEGVEVDFTALPTPNLRLYGGLALIDASIEDYPAGNCSFGQDFRQECPASGFQDLSGGNLPFSPDWKASLSAVYTVKLQQSFDLLLKGSVRAQDDISFSLAQDEFAEQDGYEIVDISVTLEDRDGNWDATYFIQNATDEFFVTNIAPTSDIFLPNGYLHRFPKTAERTQGVRFTYRW
ncbi:MAG: TonB-dependent receptor, partial [Pseudomonadales bacterium]